MSYLTAEDLLARAAESRKHADVEVLGGTVKVRGLTAAEDSAVSAATTEFKQGSRGGGMKFRPDGRQRATVKYGLVEPKLDDNQIIRFLSTVGADDCAKIVDKINELSGTTEEDAEAISEAFPEPRA